MRQTPFFNGFLYLRSRSYVQTFRRYAVYNELYELRFQIHIKQALYQTNTNTFKTSRSASVQNLIINVRKNTFRRFGDEKCGKKGLTFLRPLDVFCANKLKYLQIGLILWLKGNFLSEKCRRKCVDLGSKKIYSDIYGYCRQNVSQTSFI